jgi:hypothetical protein
VAEWVRVDASVRRDIRERGCTAIEPSKPLEAFARELEASGLTNSAECDRCFAR